MPTAAGIITMTAAAAVSSGGESSNTATTSPTTANFQPLVSPAAAAQSKPSTPASSASGSSGKAAAIDYRQPATYEAALLQLDIVGFTNLSAAVGPKVMLELLDRLFANFDRVIGRRGGLKIAVVGDAVIVACGVPNRQPLHVSCWQAAKIGVDFLRTLDAFASVTATKTKNHRLRARIGIHVGEVLAGVLGDRCPSFQVFGETLDICQLMEQSGEPGAVHVSADALRLLTMMLPDGSKAAPDIKVLKVLEDGTAFIGRDRAAAASLGIAW